MYLTIKTKILPSGDYILSQKKFKVTVSYFFPPVHFKTIWTPCMCVCIYMHVQYGPFQESNIHVYSHSDQIGHVRDTFGKL